MNKMERNNWLFTPKVPKSNKDAKHNKLMKKELLILETTYKYAEKSSAHGIQYIFEDGQLPTERLLWGIIVVFGLSFRYL